ncbi:unnamed protein product [Leptosia nina]|uniref:Gustatory receptor n=1 Tax=Leptosia nina TaxID=320188 RepID=A0AAV1J991_9NEOP
MVKKILAQFYSLSLIIIVTYSTMNCCNVINPSQFMSLIEYDLSVIISMIYNSKVLQFIAKLKCLDGYLRINRRHYKKVQNRSIVITTVLWLIRLSFMALGCVAHNCYHSFTPFVVNVLSLLALDLNRVWRFTILNTIRYRMKLLRCRLEENPQCSYYLYVADMKTMKEDKIRFCLLMYKHIGNLLDIILPEFYAQEPVESLGFTVMHIVHVSFLLMSPSVLFELFQVEVDKIRLLLMDRIIEDKGKSKGKGRLSNIFTIYECQIVQLQNLAMHPGQHFAAIGHF